MAERHAHCIVSNKKGSSGACPAAVCTHKKENLATVLDFCSAEKREKNAFIAITRAQLQKVLDANDLTNCRRVRNVQICSSSK